MGIFIYKIVIFHQEFRSFLGYLYSAVFWAILKQGLITVAVNNKFKNSVDKIVEKAKNSYNKNLFAHNRNNPKKTWSLINNLMGKKRSKPVKSIVRNNQTLTNDTDIANSMNEFFATVATELDKKLPTLNPNNPPINRHNIQQHNNNINQSFFLTPVSINECITVINNLKNTNSHIDCIPISLLKKLNI